MSIDIEDLRAILNSPEIPDGISNQVKGWIINRVRERIEQLETGSKEEPDSERRVVT